MISKIHKDRASLPLLCHDYKDTERKGVSFLWNFFISREAATAERRYKKEKCSENYMHRAAFSTRTCLLLPLSSFPPPPSHSPPSNAITGEPACAPFPDPPSPPPEDYGQISAASPKVEDGLQFGVCEYDSWIWTATVIMYEFSVQW